MKKIIDRIDTRRIAYELDVHQQTVVRWKDKGIPLEYWWWFIEKEGVSLEEMWEGYREIAETCF